LAIEGSFTASSGRMMGSAKERRYEYEVVQLETEFHGTIGESEKDTINQSHLLEADRVFFTITGGHLGDEMAYRWIAGPFPTKRRMEDAIEDMMLYGSP
jgi:hypothetical protein